MLFSVPPVLVVRVRSLARNCAPRSRTLSARETPPRSLYSLPRLQWQLTRQPGLKPCCPNCTLSSMATVPPPSPPTQRWITEILRSCSCCWRRWERGKGKASGQLSAISSQRDREQQRIAHLCHPDERRGWFLYLSGVAAHGKVTAERLPCRPQVEIDDARDVHHLV